MVDSMLGQDKYKMILEQHVWGSKCSKTDIDLLKKATKVR